MIEVRGMNIIVGGYAEPDLVWIVSDVTSGAEVADREKKDRC